MDVFGSFTLLLAFVCAVYAFVGGIFAIKTRHPLLVKSTRQAGIATCVLIFIATFSVEYLLFSDNFSQAYVVSHSNRDLSTFYKVAALWSGQEGSLLFWSFLLSVYVISVLIAYRNKNGELMPYVGVILAGVQIFFLTLNNFVENPFKTLATRQRQRRARTLHPHGRQRPQSAAAVSGNGHSSAESLFRLYGFHHSVRVCPRRTARPLSRRKVDSPHAQMDHDRLVLPVARHSPWRALGLRRSRLGRLLGLGSG